MALNKGIALSPHEERENAGRFGLTLRIERLNCVYSFKIFDFWLFYVWIISAK